MRETFNLHGVGEVFILKIFRYASGKAYLERPKSRWGSDRQTYHSRMMFEGLN